MTYYLVVAIMLHGGGEGLAVREYPSKIECQINAKRAGTLFPGKTIDRTECYQRIPDADPR